MFFPSKYNHLIQVIDKKGKTINILTNLLSGATDIVNLKIYTTFVQAEENGHIQENTLYYKETEYFLRKGYLYKNEKEEEKFLSFDTEKYCNRDLLTAELNGGHYGFITSMYCNLNCPYCFQKENANKYGFLTKKQVDLGFEAIENNEKRIQNLKNLSSTTPKISVTGGEPLLLNESKDVLDYLLNRIEEKEWPYTITTNGTCLKQFVKRRNLSNSIKGIQVTLDGYKEVHDSTRGYKNGKSSFDDIVAGVDQALNNGWPIIIRVNLSVKNVKHLHELADFIEKRGWSNFENMYAYISPVTEHTIIKENNFVVDEDVLLSSLLEEIKRYSSIRDIFDIRHFRGFDYAERIIVNKEPKYPIIYRCEAVMGMFIFDPLGDVHVCLEAVGNSKLRVGKYYPEWNLSEESLKKWTEYHALNLRECHDCKVRFICAGGCKRDADSHLNKLKCMPFLNEIDIAWKYYAKTDKEIFI